MFKENVNKMRNSLTSSGISEKNTIFRVLESNCYTKNFGRAFNFFKLFVAEVMLYVVVLMCDAVVS
jgi:hypothetical protein